ncbi:SDR family oxidoreductase [Nocardioides korecus]
MRVFVTGASGWIGSASVRELLSAGHEVVGLARSDRSAAALESSGATVLRGDLDDVDGLRAGARASEAVLHLANKHDFEHPEVSNKAERDAVQALLDELAGSGRPLLLASGVAVPGLDRPLVEDDRSPFDGPDSPRGGTENLALSYADRGVRPVSLRFAPTVHGTGDHGFVAALVGIARERGVSAYVGDGTGRWPAVHVDDAARLVRLALEDAHGPSVVHAVAEEGVATRAIAEGIGRLLDLPVTSVPADDAREHFGWLGMFFGMDLPASAALTRERLGWTPTGPTLLEDLERGAYAGA